MLLPNKDLRLGKNSQEIAAITSSALEDEENQLVEYTLGAFGCQILRFEPRPLIEALPQVVLSLRAQALTLAC